MKEHFLSWVEIHLDAIEHNVRTIKQAVGDALVMAVVKADGYGHGMVETAEYCVKGGAEWLGVTYVEEGKCLRETGFTQPILVLGYPQDEEAEDIVSYDLTQTVFTANTLEALQLAAQSLGKKAMVHLVVDTGLNRDGVREEAALSTVEFIKGLKNVELRGIYTHFASPYEDSPFTQIQYDRFQELLEQLKKAGCDIPLQHCSNSAAMYEFPEFASDIVRCGYVLIDKSPAWRGKELPLRQALQWKTRITFTRDVPQGETIGYSQEYTAPRDMKIAICQIGYDDGISKQYANQGIVLVHGKKVPIIGGICMSHFFIDVTDLDDPQAGDEVVLIGEQDGEWATIVDMSSKIHAGDAEVLGNIGYKFPRLYFDNGKFVKIKRL